VPRSDAHTPVFAAAFAGADDLRVLRTQITSALLRRGRSVGHAGAVRLVFNELATNALMHGAPRYHARVDVDERATRIEVRDAGIGTVIPRAPAFAEGGYGLRLVDALSSRWGCRPEKEAGGKTVWADVDAVRGI
jgi:anti-sigma regulatory factor (Ser/Thr protein kinase)